MRRPAAPRRGEVEVERDPRARRGLLRERADRDGKPGLLEHVRVELDHGVSQLPDRLHERRVGAIQRRMRCRLAGLLQLVARRQEVLERVVVQGLGEHAALPLLRVQRVREQPRALRGQLLDEGRTSRQHQRQQRAGGADPREEAGLGER